jgi:hypothetical protein
MDFCATYVPKRVKADRIFFDPVTRRAIPRLKVQLDAAENNAIILEFYYIAQLSESLRITVSC